MKKQFIATLVVLVLSSLVFGQNSRMGTSSSTQLLIVPGARYLSGGGAVATATGMDAVFWNPAGLSMGESSVDVIFSNRQYIADIQNSFFGIATGLGDYKLGVSVRTFTVGDIDETTVFFPDGTGQVFTPNFSVVGGTLSRKLSDNNSVRVNANLVRESFGRVAASGSSFDLGVQYKGLLGMENLDVGFVLKNFGQPMKYSGEGLGVLANAQGGDRPVEFYKIDAAAFDLPFLFDMGLSYNIAGADLGLTYTSNYYATDELKFSAGYTLAGLASVSVGMQSSGVAQDLERKVGSADYEPTEVTGDWYTNPSDGVSFGASLDLSRLTGMNLSVDYSMLPMGDFGTNSIVAMRLAY